MGTLGKVNINNMEYEKEFVLFLRLVGVVCNYGGKNSPGFNGKPRLPSVMLEDAFKMRGHQLQLHAHTIAYLCTILKPLQNKRGCQAWEPSPSRSHVSVFNQFYKQG